MAPHTKPPAINTGEAEYSLRPIEGELPKLPDQLRRHRHSFTGFFFSLFIHTTLLLILVWLAVRATPPPGRIKIAVSIENEPAIIHQPAVEEIDMIEIERPEDSIAPADIDQQELIERIDLETSATENPITDHIAESTDQPTPQNIAPEQPKKTLPLGGGLAGREAVARAQLAASKGGNLASEQAVEDGLKWIVGHQMKDGSWGLKHQRAISCNCPDEGERESKTAATGLSLLAILGAGYTHRIGPYQSSVDKGLSYLIKTQRPNGGWLGDSDRMYSHAIATLALSEAYQLTKDPAILMPLDKARQYMVNSQNKSDSRRKGSWGYEPGQPGDITLTGWHIAALKSTQSAGMSNPPDTLRLAERFVDSLATSEGRFGYTDPSKGTSATTAIGLFSKMLLGLHRESPLLVQGGDYLVELGPSDHDIYYNYYATQVLFHRQGNDWRSWNQKMRDFLIGTQVQKPGHLHGSWYFHDNHGKVGGRLYTTCMAVMTLEVYYRYLPLYEEILSDNQPAATAASNTQTHLSR